MPWQASQQRLDWPRCGALGSLGTENTSVAFGFIIRASQGEVVSKFWAHCGSQLLCLPLLVRLIAVVSLLGQAPTTTAARGGIARELVAA